MSVNSIIAPSQEIYYLHYECGGESIYLKVHSGQERCTCVAVSGKKGRQGKYCRGVYEIKWITFLGQYGYYDKYWRRHSQLHKAKTIFGERIAHFLKITTRNQYLKAKELVLTSLV